MSKKKKPVVILDPQLGDPYYLLSVVMPALKKVGMFKEAEDFIKEVRNNFSYLRALKLAKKYVILNY